eukprot:Lankesteria_metandrocarpae@DN4423_c0_g1_i1.p1
MSSKFEFAVDFAPSSRGKCKGCKSTITKGDLRMGVKSVLDADRAAEMDSSRRAMIEAHQWYHVKFDCFGTYRKTAKWWTENTPELESIVGIDDVEDDDRDEIDEILNELREGNVPGAKSKAKGKAKSKASPKKRTGKGSPSRSSAADTGSDSEGGSSESGDDDSGAESDDGGSAKPSSSAGRSPQDKRKRARSGEDAGSSGGETPAKRQKTDAGAEFDYQCELLDGETVADIQKSGIRLMKKTVAQLKEMLKSNEQLQSGRKIDLVTRVSEAEILGALPKCPECGDAVVRWNSSSGEYSCPGSFDEDKFRRCKWKSDEVQRVSWKTV